MNKEKFELKVNSNNVSWDAKSDLKLADENQKKFDKEREKYVKEIEKLKANGGGLSFVNEIKAADVMKLQEDNIDSYIPKFLKIDIQKLQEILKTKFSKFSDIVLQSSYDIGKFHGFVLTGVRVGVASSEIWVCDAYGRNANGNGNGHDIYFDDVHQATGVSMQKSFYTIAGPSSYYSWSDSDLPYVQLSNNVYLPGFDTFSSDVQFVLIPITLGKYPNAPEFFEYESLFTDDGGDVHGRFPEPYSNENTINVANDLIELYPKFQECLSLVDGIK